MGTTSTSWLDFFAHSLVNYRCKQAQIRIKRYHETYSNIASIANASKGLRRFKHVVVRPGIIIQCDIIQLVVFRRRIEEQESRKDARFTW